MKFTEQERDFLKQEFADLCHAAINSMITAGSFVRSIDRIEAIVSERITHEPGGSGQKRESPFIGEITISDLRKLFAHRASRISEDINQGANQLMTLTDFRLALADMRWRIYNDGLSEPGESGQSAEDVESIFYKRCDIARCDGASIEYLTKPNAIEAMRLHASQVCADKEQEIDRINESLTVMVNRNAELEKELEYAKIR